MMNKFTKGILTAAVALSSVATSYAQLSVSGQYRPRLEVRNGFKTPLADAQKGSAFVEHRARLTVGYKKEKIGFKMSGQDVRIWGETGQINKSDGVFSIHEAYGEYIPNDKLTLRVGRQELAYDGHRLIGTLDWAAQARSFDAINMMYKDTTGNELNVMVSYNQNGALAGKPEPAKLVADVYGGGNSGTFQLPLPLSQQLLYYKRTLGKDKTVGLMLLSDVFGVDDSTYYNQFTVGLTPDFKFGDLKVGGQFYYTGGQAGKSLNSDSSGYNATKLGGMMFNAYVQYTKVPGMPLLGVDYLTGDDETTTDVEGWSPSYGTNHKFYGFMDYFYVGNGHGGANAKSAGLMDLYLQTTFKFGEKTKLLGHVHYFASTAERTYAPTGDKFKGGLGTEIDLVLVRTLAPGITFKAGYSQMFGATETMKVLKGKAPDSKIDGIQNWTWVMLDFTPSFLN